MKGTFFLECKKPSSVTFEGWSDQRCVHCYPDPRNKHNSNKQSNFSCLNKSLNHADRDNKCVLLKKGM